MEFSVADTVLLWVLSVLKALAPFGITAMLGVFAWKLWRHYLLYVFVRKQEWVVLEVKLPRDIFKSPKAMELVLNSMWHVREGSPVKRLLENNKRPWFSLEIVSDGGVIHFYVCTPVLYRNLIESHFYAHYPQVQVAEVPDYTVRFPIDQAGSEWDFEGEEFKFAKANALPIKTYVEYGLDKETKEELKIDPLAHLLEHLSTCGPEEQLWFQIVITAAKDETWKKEGEEMVTKILGRDKKTEDGKGYAPLPSKFEAEVVEAIQRKMDKLAFIAGIRALYIFKKGKADKRKGVGLWAATKAFGSAQLNTLVKGRDLGYTFVWQDPFGWRDARDRKEMSQGYVRRSYFYPPVQVKSELTFILTTEEIATLYHLPGGVAQPPTLARIESKRAEAPPNLPI